MAWGKLEDTYWRDRALKALGRSARELEAYLKTSPHRNRLGYYALDLAYAASDLSTLDSPWTPGDVAYELDRLHEAGRIGWDPATGVVYIRAWWTENGLENGNVVKAALKDLRAAPDSPWLLELLQRVASKRAEHLASGPNPKDAARYDPLVLALEDRVRRLAQAPDLFVGPQLVVDPGASDPGSFTGMVLAESTPPGGNVDNPQEPSAPADPNGSGNPSPNGSLDGSGNGMANGMAGGSEYLAVAVAVAEPSQAGPSAEQEKPAIRDSAREPDEGAADDHPKDERVDEPLELLPTEPLARLLAEYPAARDVLAQLEHPGGVGSTEATLRARFLYDEGRETLSDGATRGLPLASRLPLVAGALLEYADQGERAWSRPLFAGYCRRIRERDARDQATQPDRARTGFVVLDQHGRQVDPRTGHRAPAPPPPPEEEPEPTPEERARIAELARALSDALRPPAVKGNGKSPEEVEAEVQRQRALIREHQGGE